jgi:hypothetical protein
VASVTLFLFGLTQLVVREQRNKDSTAQGPIPNNDSLDVLSHIDSVFDIFKVRFVTNASAITVL